MVVADVVDLGWIEKFFQGASHGLKPHVQLVYQIGGVDENDAQIQREDGKPWLVFGRRYVLTTNERAGFYKELCGILGKKKCDELLESGELDTEELIGKNVNGVVTHREWEGKTFANVEPLKPWNPRHGELIEPRDYTRRHESEKWVEPDYSAFGPGPTDKSAPAASDKPAPAPKPRPEPRTAPLEPEAGEEPVSLAIQGQIRSLARHKLPDDGPALQELCRERFGKKFAFLSADEGGQLIDVLRRMKDAALSDGAEDVDPFADEPATEAPDVKAPAVKKPDVKAPSAPMVTDAQVAAIAAIAARAFGRADRDADLLALTQKEFGVTPDNLNRAQASEIIDELKALLAAQANPFANEDGEATEEEARAMLMPKDEPKAAPARKTAHAASEAYGAV